MFDSAAQLRLCVEVMAGMVTGLTIHADAMRAAADEGFLTATDLADWLVQNTGMPFRNAHAVAGKAVKLAESQGCGLSDLSFDSLRALDPGITRDVFAALEIERSVARKTSFGGTAPDRVREAVARARERLA